MTWKAALLFLGAVAMSSASALPQSAPAQEECDLRLWVRADDLSPSTIVEGDVRLLNNLTSLSDTALSACQIVDWSLVLRYRERAAISIPLASVQLPEKPQYNYTWDVRGDRGGRRQFKVDNIFSGGEDMSSLFGNATDPYAAEKKEYDRRLEEYALALSSADKWIIRDEDVTFFETALSVNKTMEIVEALQQVTLPFGIAVPNVRFPPANNAIWGGFYSNEGVGDQILHANEQDLGYFARIRLANGSTVEVEAGRSKFFVPGTADLPVTKVFNATFLQQEKQDQRCGDSNKIFSADQGACLDSKNTQAAANDSEAPPTLQLRAVVQMPTTLTRGESFSVSGTVAASDALRHYNPKRIKVRFHTFNEPHWGRTQLDKAGNSTSKTAEDLDVASKFLGGYASRDAQSSSSALFLQGMLQQFETWKSSGTIPDSMSRSFHFPKDSPAQSKSFQNDSRTFSVEITAEGAKADLPETRRDLFSTQKAEMILEIVAERREDEDEDDADEDSALAKPSSESSASEKFHSETMKWSQFGHPMSQFLQSLDKKNSDVTLEARIPLEDIQNAPIRLLKRDPLLQRLLDEQDSQCQISPRSDYFITGAQAPRFVDISTEERMRTAVELVNPCAKHMEGFTTMDAQESSVVAEHIPSSLTGVQTSANSQQEGGRLKYRKTKYQRRSRRHDCEPHFGACGGSGNDVGVVWARNVMLPSLVAGWGSKEQTGPVSFVLQG